MNKELSIEDVQIAQELSHGLYNSCEGKFGHITTLALSMALAEYYVMNYDEESQFNNPKEFGKMVGELVEKLIETGKIANPN